MGDQKSGVGFDVEARQASLFGKFACDARSYVDMTLAVNITVIDEAARQVGQAAVDVAGALPSEDKGIIVRANECRPETVQHARRRISLIAPIEIALEAGAQQAGLKTASFDLQLIDQMHATIEIAWIGYSCAVPVRIDYGGVGHGIRPSPA